jgi:glucose uptake protein
MLLPTTYGATMMTLVLAALLWSTWANTQRADRKWRFELYAFDFALGALAIVVLLAVTIGNAGSANSFTFDDILTVASKRNMATAASGGAVYCLGNLMILAGVVLAGMSTALPVGSAMGLFTAVAWAAMNRLAPANPGMVYGGAGVALVGVLAAAMAQREAALAAPVKKGMHAGWKGFILSCVGGIIVGIGLPIIESSRHGDIGVGAYGAVVFMTLGVLLMTPLVTLYFLNLPVQGEAASPLDYLKGTKGQHLLGIVGGMLWGAGTVAFFASAGGSFSGAPSFLGNQALAYGGAVAGALCGLLMWGEQAGAPKAKMAVLGSMILLAAGAAMVFLGV